MTTEQFQFAIPLILAVIATAFVLISKEKDRFENGTFLMVSAIFWLLVAKFI